MPSWKKVITSGSSAQFLNVTTSGDVDVSGDLNVSEYIYHTGDANTNIRFTDDRIRIKAGGISYVDFNDASAAPHDITFNDGSNNVDLVIKGNSNNPLFKTDSSANRIGTHGKGTPAAAFHIGGDQLLVDGNISGSAIEASGNIIVAGTVDGRDLQTDGTKLDGIEASADVTDTANVTSAGALMDSEVTNLAFVKSLAAGISDGNVLTANDAVADNDYLQINGTEVEGRTYAEVRSDLGIEAGATADQTITAGSGLTGGGSGDVTINIGAGTGIDVAADAISVDVSDFMTNGSDNRIVTATGTDAMNAEANLTFNGSKLEVTGSLNTSGSISSRTADIFSIVQPSAANIYDDVIELGMNSDRKWKFRAGSHHNGDYGTYALLLEQSAASYYGDLGINPGRGLSLIHI